MPVPISLVNNNPHPEKPYSGLLDVSFLANLPKEASTHSVFLSDKDANDVMKIWLNAKKISKDIFAVKSLADVDNNTILRLKSRGLISGSDDSVKFTQKGRAVVKTMTLGESNNFLKQRKPKSYNEILASMDKRGKGGFRIAEKEDGSKTGIFDEYSHLMTCAQSDISTYDLIMSLMEDIKRNLGRGMVKTDGRYPSFEMSDETMGQCWIEVAYMERDRIIYIDKYYDSERLNDEYGANAKIPFDPNFDLNNLSDIEPLLGKVIPVVERMLK